jgi:hypothetical protein
VRPLPVTFEIASIERDVILLPANAVGVELIGVREHAEEQ